MPDSLICCDERSDEDVNVPGDCLSKRARYLNLLLDHFWRRWKSEYLLELRDYHRYHQQHKITNTDIIQVGDVVLVHSSDRPRGFWRLGKVEELISGADGRVRGAKV